MTISNERRSGGDRRQNDLGAPVAKEQRRRIEPRKPEVVETEISDSEWEMYFCKPEKRLGNDVSEEAEEVFGRIRS